MIHLILHIFLCTPTCKRQIGATSPKAKESPKAISGTSCLGFSWDGRWNVLWTVTLWLPCFSGLMILSFCFFSLFLTWTLRDLKLCFLKDEFSSLWWRATFLIASYACYAVHTCIQCISLPALWSLVIPDETSQTDLKPTYAHAIPYDQ